MMKTYVPFILCLLLAGCADQRPHQQTPQVLQPVIVPQSPTPSPQAPNPEVLAANNATQQSFTGLGAQLNSMVQRLDASLVKVESSITAQATANATANAELRAALNASVQASADLRANLQSEIKASAQANAELRAKLEALTAAQVGLTNSMQQMTQTISAGRDVVQFTQEMMQVMLKAFESITYTVATLAAAAVTINSAASYMTLRIVYRMSTLAERVDTDPAKQETKRHAIL